RELCAAAHLRHNQMTIEACQPSRAMNFAVPERLVMAIEADLIRALDRLAPIDAKLDQISHRDAAAHDRVIATGTVTSFASAALEIVFGFDLKQPSHLRFRELAGEVGMARIAIDAADVARLREVADVGIVVTVVRARTDRECEQAHGRRDSDAFSVR